MEKITKEKLIPIISIIIGFLGSLLSKDVPDKIRYIGLAIISGFALFYIIYLIKESIKESKDISSNSIVLKTKEYFKYITKLIKSNEKILKKYEETTEKELFKTYNYKILNYNNLENKKTSKLNKLRIKQKRKIESCYCKTLKIDCFKINNKEDEKIVNNAKKVNELIIKTSFDLKRILLSLGQYNLRIKLGSYIYKRGNILQKVESLIDFIGWTNILKGKRIKGFKAIFFSIELIDKKIEEYSDKEKDYTYYKLKILKLRALRHITTTYYTYKDISKLNLDKEINILLNDKELKEYSFNSDLNSEYNKLIIGFKNNEILKEYYSYLESNKKTNGKEFKSLNILHNEISPLIDEANKYDDKHREIKLRVLENEIIFNNNKKLTEEYKSNLDNIEFIFNKNIYFDDAMEMFIKQKIQFLFKEVEKIII